MITIVDFKMGNVGSIRNMLRKIGCESRISADPAAILEADKLILPGVGAFDEGMTRLEESGLIPLLRRRVIDERTPVLGICLGMQLMAERSEEGTRSGLGWVPADVLRFRPHDPKMKVPHMGWNVVEPAASSPLTDGMPDESRFYFVHSYYVRCADPGDVLLTTQYGEPFHSGFRRGNVWGVQFHPEKSHRFGMTLLNNFATKVH